MSTTKKTVLITGGASGIGLGTVKYLLNKGNYEVISFSRGAGHIEEAKKKLGDRAQEVLFLQGDISSEADVQKLYEEIESRYGKLVNSAGVMKLGGVEEQSLKEWRRVVDTNLTSVFLMVKTMLPLLKKGTNASIVNLSSLNARRPGGSAAYCASKAGVENLTQYLAKELGKYQIRVNAVSPAAVHTNIYVSSGDYTHEGYDKWSEEKRVLYPLGRIECLWTTGSIYAVDGGISV